MGGTELVYNLFAECQPGSPNTHSGLCVIDPSSQALPVIRSIFVALVVKSVLTLITFGIKLPAGIFIPTLGGKLSKAFYMSIDIHENNSWRMCRAYTWHSRPMDAELTPQQPDLCIMQR